MDEYEVEFHRVVRCATGALWLLGAVEETLAALHDVLDEVAHADDSKVARALNAARVAQELETSR
ncbi:MAG: hypothetical protein AUI14_17535 [Actinobacteria bacterium 13_2_20CM_2_71_6]|nr:MAG: hypothetical protein AUI14_17535 [Actinobacteria bacterium 13_2_20CM_2_71_6]